MATSKLIEQFNLFFSTRKVLRFFLQIAIIIALIKFFYEENRISIKESDSYNFRLEDAPKPEEAFTYENLMKLNKIDEYCSPYLIKDSHLGWYWQESDDIALVNAWYHFKTSVAKIGMSNIDPEKYQNKIDWFQRFVHVRKNCLPYYFKNEKKSGDIFSATGYGLTKGFLTNLLFLDLKEIDTMVDRYFHTNEFYLYSKENRIINLATSVFFSIGLLFPWFLVVSFIYKKNKK